MAEFRLLFVEQLREKLPSCRVRSRLQLLDVLDVLAVMNSASPRAIVRSRVAQATAPPATSQPRLQSDGERAVSKLGVLPRAKAERTIVALWGTVGAVRPNGVIELTGGSNRADTRAPSSCGVSGGLKQRGVHHCMVSSALRNRSAASQKNTTPMIASATICGQTIARPAPR